MAEHGLYGNDERIGAREERAFHLAVARYAHRPEVTGIDLGVKLRAGTRMDDENEICVRIHVRHKLRELPDDQRIPIRINDVPTDVIEAVYADEAMVRGRRGRPGVPLQPGLGLSAATGPSGSLGMIVKDVGGRAQYLVSASHVLAPSTGVRPGEPIVQPARDAGGIRTVARLARLNRDTDSAIARLSAPPRRHSNEPIGIPGVGLAAARFPRIGDILQKSGAVTGVTRARVDGLGVFEGLRFALRLVPVDSEGVQHAVSRPGDSGAVWHDPATGAVVGLHCRGNRFPNDAQEVALATSMHHVLQFLGVELP